MDADLVKRGGELNDKFETVSKVIDVQLKSALVDLGPVLVGLLQLVADLAKEAGAVADAFKVIEQKRTETLTHLAEKFEARAKTPATYLFGGPDKDLERAARVRAELGKRAAEQKPPVIAPTHTLHDVGGKTKAGPRDDTAQKTQEVLAALDSAERQVLQAMLELATSTEARANLQKQIAAKEAEVERAHLDKQIADLAADKGLPAAKKKELTAQLEVAKTKADEAARLKQRAIDDAAADQIAQERRQLADQDLDAEAQLLQLQSDLTFSERTRAAIALRLVEIAYQREKAELEGLIAAEKVSLADKEIARRKLAALNATQPGRVEQTQRTASEPQRQVGQIVAGIKQQSNAADDARAMYAEIDRLRQADKLSEREAAQAKAQVNAQYHQLRLEQASSFFGNLATLSESSNKTLAAIGKAAAIAQATIDGILAVQKALASAPPPFNFALAAAAGVAAAVNVAKIAGLKEGGPVTGPGGPTDDKVLRWLSNGEHVVNTRAASRPGVRPLLDALNAGVDLSRLLPAPVGVPSPIGAPAGGSRDFHFNYHDHSSVSVQDPDLGRLLERQPRAFRKHLESLFRNGDIRMPRE
jgi:hypothetical protein